jgi:hypothetical protein
MVTDLARRRALACLGLALAAPVFAEEHRGHHAMAAGAAGHTGSAELGALAVFDARGILWAAHKQDGYVVVSRSGDLGKTWSGPIRVSQVPEATDTGGDARPKIATGPGGEVYVTWTRALGKPYTGEIRFSRSLDGGRSFSAPVAVHADRQLIAHRFDALAVNRDGEVFVAWIDKRDLEAAKAKLADYRGAAVYFAVSSDRGASFRGDYKLADHSCECCRLALAPANDGSVLAMWRHIFEPNIRDHALARMYPDGRAGTLRRATFDDWRIDACPHHGPSLAADGAGNLHAVWFSQAQERSGAFYGRLRGDTVEAQQKIGGETAEHADLAIIGERVAVAWKEFDGERSQLRAMLSENGGNNWRDIALGATAGASDRPRVLVWQGRFYAFWNTRNEALSVVTLS